MQGCHGAWLVYNSDSSFGRSRPSVRSNRFRGSCGELKLPAFPALMLRLALPLILAELAWLSMGIVDTMMVGHLANSAEAIGGASLAGMIFSVAGIFGIGLLMGMDTLVAQSFGAGKLEDCNKSLWNMIYLTLPLAPVLMGLYPKSVV